jgi:hypothetical protein
MRRHPDVCLLTNSLSATHGIPFLDSNSRIALRPRKTDLVSLLSSLGPCVSKSSSWEIQVCCLPVFSENDIWLQMQMKNANKATRLENQIEGFEDCSFG